PRRVLATLSYMSLSIIDVPVKSSEALASRSRRGLRRVSCVAAMVMLTLGASGVRAGAQPTPPPLEREFRAAWITPTEGSDWPSRPGLSVEAQKIELAAVLDAAKADGLNAVLLHVRTAGDAFYP